MRQKSQKCFDILIPPALLRMVLHIYSYQSQYEMEAHLHCIGEGTSELGIVVFDSVFDDLIDQLMGLWVAGSLISQ